MGGPGSPPRPGRPCYEGRSMSLTEHLSELVGKPVAAFDGRAPFDLRAKVPRLSIDWDSHVDGLGMSDLVGELLRRPDVASVEGLVFGVWDFISAADASAIVAPLCAAKDRLPALRAIFLGDILESEQELAWIKQGDVAPLFAAFPKLTELRVRGSAGLRLAPPGDVVRHSTLTSLVVESAGLSRELVAAVVGGDMPALRHLELWLGSEQDGGTSSIDDLAPLLEGRAFPALESLALKGSETADALAAAVASAPILARLKKLDLSLGTLSDEGAEPLLASEAVRRLHDLDLRKSFLSPEIIKRFHALTPVIVDVRGSRFGKEEGDRRPSTAPARNVSVDLPLARLKARRA